MYASDRSTVIDTTAGVAIGLNAAFLNIITEWLSDVKLGHCKTAFYLNENFCCWGEDNGTYTQILNAVNLTHTIKGVMTGNDGVPWVL